MKYIVALVLLITFACVMSSCGPKDKKHEVSVYGDFKCPYTKKFEEKIMPKLTREYIDTEKVTYTYVNAAILGDDARLGSAAAHAVQHIAPHQFLQFRKEIFKLQESEGKEWITPKLLENVLRKLDLSDSEEKQIKNLYENPHSIAWKNMESDQKRIDNEHIEEMPTVKIDGKKVNNAYDYSEIKRILEE